MVRYNRIPTRTDSEDVNDYRDDGVGERRFSPPAEEQESSRNKKTLKRRESNDASCPSAIDSDEEDYLRSSSNDGDNDDDTERSPLNKNVNYASDVGLVASDLACDAILSASPLSMYPSTTAISFDLDDDDDDDELEANLKRYHLDFSSTDGGDYLTRTGTTRTTNNDDANGGSNQFGFSGGGNASNRCSSAAKYLWFSFQSVRQQARQRRAQMLLQQSERNWRQSLKICVLTNCDATDSGILLVVAIMVLWIVALMLTKNAMARTRGLVLGIILFVVRVGTRPLHHWCLKCWQQRQLSRQQQRTLGPIPQNSSPSRKKSAGSFELRAIPGGGDSSSSSNNNNNDNNNGDGTASPTSTGSDPTIAAI